METVKADLREIVNKQNRARITWEEELVNLTDSPVTESTLRKGLKGLGVRKGMSLISHISLSSMGWVCGGAQAVVGGLMGAVTARGNLIMPSYTGYNTDPSLWRYPPVPKSWWPKIRRELPPYDKILSPTRGMGAVVECFRSHREVLRSNHPRSSFLAWGDNKATILASEAYDFPFGTDGPLGKTYELGAYILMIGVDYTVINSFYLAYFLASIPNKSLENCKSVTEVDGKRKWVTYVDYTRKTSMFEQIYKEYVRTKDFQTGSIGNATCRLISQVDLVNFAKERLELQSA